MLFSSFKVSKLLQKNAYPFIFIFSITVVLQLLIVDCSLWFDELGIFFKGILNNSGPLPIGNHFFQFLFIKTILFFQKHFYFSTNYFSFETIFHIVPFVSSLLFIVFTYKLCIQNFSLTNYWLRLLIFTLLSFSPLALWYSRDGRTYSTVLLFSSLNAIYFFKLTDTLSKTVIKFIHWKLVFVFLIVSFLGCLNFASFAFIFLGQLYVLFSYQLFLKLNTKLFLKVIISMVTFLFLICLIVLLTYIFISTFPIVNNGFTFPPTNSFFRPLHITLARLFSILMLGPLRLMCFHSLPFDIYVGLTNFSLDEIIILLTSFIVIFSNIFLLKFFIYRKTIIISFLLVAFPFVFHYFAHTVLNSYGAERYFIYIHPYILLLLFSPIIYLFNLPKKTIYTKFLFTIVTLIILSGQIKMLTLIQTHKTGPESDWKAVEHYFRTISKTTEKRPLYPEHYIHPIYTSVAFIKPTIFQNEWNKKNILFSIADDNLSMFYYLNGFNLISDSSGTPPLCDFIKKGYTIWFMQRDGVYCQIHSNTYNNNLWLLNKIKRTLIPTISISGPPGGIVNIYKITECNVVNKDQSNLTR